MKHKTIYGIMALAVLSLLLLSGCNRLTPQLPTPQSKQQPTYKEPESDDIRLWEREFPVLTSLGNFKECVNNGFMISCPETYDKNQCQRIPQVDETIRIDCPNYLTITMYGILYPSASSCDEFLENERKNGELAYSEFTHHSITLYTTTNIDDDLKYHLCSENGLFLISTNNVELAFNYIANYR